MNYQQRKKLAAEANVNYNEWIGKRVRKLSGKPFKSTFKVNTVIGICVHDHRPEVAFIFAEDTSQVSCVTCELVPEQAGQTDPVVVQ